MTTIYDSLLRMLSLALSCLEVVLDLVRQVPAAGSDMDNNVVILWQPPLLEDCIPDHDVLAAERELGSLRRARLHLFELFKAA